MKGITPITITLMLLVITVLISGLGWNYFSGYYETITSKAIKIVPGSVMRNEVIIQNIGADEMTGDDLEILVNGEETSIESMEPETIEPGEASRMSFATDASGEIEVRIISPGNTLGYFSVMGHPE